jgi:hypothetical protein
MDIKFGLDTFGDMQVDDSGKPISAALDNSQRCRRGSLRGLNGEYRNKFRRTSSRRFCESLRLTQFWQESPLAQNRFNWVPALPCYLVMIQSAFSKDFQQSMRFQMVALRLLLAEDHSLNPSRYLVMTFRNMRCSLKRSWNY